MNRVRVVHLCHALEMGGMEKLLVEFARHANRDRFDLHFISLTRRGPAADEIERLGWPVSAMTQPAGVRLTLPFRLAQLLRRDRANILHTHNTKPLLYGAPAAGLTAVDGIVHTRHGQRRGATRRQTALFNLAARRADRVVSVSKDSQRLAAQQGIPAGKLVTIHNGIDLSRFPFGGPKPAAPAVMVGRLNVEKDLSTLLRAAAIVAKQEPSFNLQLVGDGPCASELKQLCDQLDLRNRVQFLGQIADVSSVLSAASMFVLSSLTEGISLAILEAMARGLPIIATRVGGNPEVVIDGQTGFLVPTQSPQEMAVAILKLYRDPIGAQRLGAAGRRRVETHFDARGMVAHYESLYAEILQAKHPIALPA